MSEHLPDFREWSSAAVRLLQGTIEAEEERLWSVTLANVSPLNEYFARIGLRLIVEEAEGLAYLRQLAEDEVTPEYDRIPRLFRATRLSYGQTLLCVLLRDALRRFEEEQTRDERCIVDVSDLTQRWAAFFPEHDDVKRRQSLGRDLTRLEEIGFVRRFGDSASQWEVRRILKAKLNAEELESLLDRLRAAVRGDRSESDGESMSSTVG